MKIIHCLNHFLPHQIAGTEVYTYSLAKQLISKGVDCLVLIPNYGSADNESYYYEDIRVIQYAEPSIVDRSLIMGKRAPDGLKAYIEILKDEKPNIIHFHELAGSNGISLLHVKAAKALGIKIIMPFHLATYSCRTGNLMYRQKQLCDGVIDEKRCSLCFLQQKGFENYSKPLWAVSNLLFKLNIDSSSFPNKIGTSLSFPFLIQKLKNNLQELSHLCDKLVLLTEWYYEVLLKNGLPPEKMEIISQGVPSQASEINSDTLLNHSPLKLIFVGRVSPLKGIHLLIKALKHISPEKVILDIYGSSTDLEFEKKCKEESEDMYNIRWMGKVEQKNILQLMQQYHALCLPSTFSEMSPLVIQEAFAAGIPVIASNMYGNTEQVKHEKNGLIFSLNDTTSLPNQIKRLIDNPELLQQLKKNIQKPKSFTEIGEAYFNLYNNLFKPATDPVTEVFSAAQ